MDKSDPHKRIKSLSFSAGGGVSDSFYNSKIFKIITQNATYSEKDVETFLSKDDLIFLESLTSEKDLRTHFIANNIFITIERPNGIFERKITIWSDEWGNERISKIVQKLEKKEIMRGAVLNGTSLGRRRFKQ